MNVENFESARLAPLTRGSHSKELSDLLLPASAERSEAGRLRNRQVPFTHRPLDLDANRREPFSYLMSFDRSSKVESCQ